MKTWRPNSNPYMLSGINRSRGSLSQLFLRLNIYSDFLIINNKKL